MWMRIGRRWDLACGCGSIDVGIYIDMGSGPECGSVRNNLYSGNITFVRFGALPPSRAVFPSASSSSSFSAVRPPRFPFHDLRSDPRSRSRSTTFDPISVPVPVPILVPVPRGSASRCFSLRSRAALLYIKKAALNHGQSLS